jgi:hypothetical protein
MHKNCPISIIDLRLIAALVKPPQVRDRGFRTAI